tara:strand:+ start:5576 stop:5713 length:138 start_codon:yes stop_codon:yes gene_type:complete
MQAYELHFQTVPDEVALVNNATKNSETILELRKKQWTLLNKREQK